MFDGNHYYLRKVDYKMRNCMLEEKRTHNLKKYNIAISKTIFDEGGNKERWRRSGHTGRFGTR